MWMSNLSINKGFSFSNSLPRSIIRLLLKIKDVFGATSICTEIIEVSIEFSQLNCHGRQIETYMEHIQMMKMLFLTASPICDWFCAFLYLTHYKWFILCLFTDIMHRTFERTYKIITWMVCTMKRIISFANFQNGRKNHLRSLCSVQCALARCFIDFPLSIRF